MRKKMYKVLTFFSLTFSLITTSYAQQNAFNFDGVNDYISGSNSDIPSGSAARTVEAWINTTADASSDQKVIVDWGSTGTGARFTMNLLWSNSLRIEVAGNGISGTTAVNDGQWHHLAVTYDPSSNPTTKLYIDGALETSGNLTVPVNTTANSTLYIGRRQDNVKYFDGDIDEVRIWNVARSQTEIQNNMMNEFCTAPANLVAYYNFNHGNANGSNAGLNTIVDFSGNDNSLTQSGASMNGTSSNYITGINVPYQMSASFDSDYTCGSYFWQATNQTLSGIGNYSATITSSTGCDSIINMFLSSGLNFLGETIDTCAASYTWPVNGTTYTTPGTYQETYTNIHGCDSIRQLNLSIGQNNTTTQTVTSCGDYLWNIDGNTYNTTGIYVANLSNQSGCDSSVTLDLTIATIDNTVTDNGDLSLTANATGAIFQWIDCATNTPISGETNANFTVTQNGEYAVVVSNGTCTDTSACITIDYVGTDDFNTHPFAFYPNPAQNELHVIFENGAEKTIEIINAAGQTVYTQETKTLNNTLNIEELPKGVYILQISSDEAVSSQRFIKN